MQPTRLATALAMGFIVVFGGFALACVVFGMLYLWPSFDALDLHPDGYLIRVLFATVFVVSGLPFAGWAAHVWHGRPRKLPT